jgi:hypothetical protein
LRDFYQVWPLSASTQNQALNALLFLYNEVLKKQIGLVEGVVRAKRPRRLPVVLTKDEVKKILAHLTGTSWLMAMILACSVEALDKYLARLEHRASFGKFQKVHGRPRYSLVGPHSSGVWRKSAITKLEAMILPFPVFKPQRYQGKIYA